MHACRYCFSNPELLQSLAFVAIPLMLRNSKPRGIDLYGNEHLAAAGLDALVNALIRLMDQRLKPRNTSSESKEGHVPKHLRNDAKYTALPPRLWR